MRWEELVRWLHLVAGVGWLGAVMVVVFVLGPALRTADANGRAQLLTQVYPRVFRLASVVVLLTAVSGATLFVRLHGWHPDALAASGREQALIIGALIGGAIGTFHFLIEPRLEHRIGYVESDPAAAERLVRLLQVIPRVGLVVLGSVVTLMVASARGW